MLVVGITVAINGVDGCKNFCRQKTDFGGGKESSPDKIDLGRTHVATATVQELLAGVLIGR
jgi:hypothetical protein